MRKYPITRWNYIYLPKIKNALRFTGIFLVVLLIELIIMGIGGLTFPY